MATVKKTSTPLKLLYSLDVCKDSYGGRHVVCVLEDPDQHRYIWCTTTDSSAYGCVPKSKYVDCTFRKDSKLNGGDTVITYLKVV